MGQYKANYDLTRIRALPLEELRKFFPRACLMVTGREFVRTGGYSRVADDDGERERVIPNGRRVERAPNMFGDYCTAVSYAKRVFGSREHYTIRVYIPEIDSPGSGR